MNTSPTAAEQAPADVGQMLIRDLVDQYPAIMPLLQPYGIDLCCGGGRPLGEALQLHGAPVDETLKSVEAVIGRGGESQAQ